jgi:hypothetical protein
MGEMGNAYKILVEEPEGTGPFERFRLAWEDNMKMDLEKLIFTQLVKKFSTFFGTRWSITVFTRTRHWSLS